MSVVQLMGGTFVLAAIAIATGIGVIPLWRARASLGWTETRCHIQRSEVEPVGENYRPAIAYTYAASGHQLSGDRIDLAVRGTSSDRSGADALVRRYPAGGDVPCWFDRDDPASVVLSRTAPATFLLLLAVLFGAVGFVFLRIGTRGALDDARGARGSDGRHLYVRRGTSRRAVIAMVAMWLVCLAAALPAPTTSDPAGEVAILLCAALATLALLHELRCLLSVVTATLPSRLLRGESGRAEWSARSPLVSPRATASLIAVAATSGTRRGKLAASYEVEVETVLTIPVPNDPSRPGSGALCMPADAPASTPGRQIDWFLEVRVHLPLGPDVTVRATIDVPPD